MLTFWNPQDIRKTFSGDSIIRKIRKLKDVLHVESRKPES